MSDIIEDLLAFLSVTGEPATCSRFGRQLADGEPHTLDENSQVLCRDCKDVS